MVPLRSRDKKHRQSLTGEVNSLELSRNYGKLTNGPVSLETQLIIARGQFKINREHKYTSAVKIRYQVGL